MPDRASQAIRTLQRAGFKGDRLKTAFAIVMRESGGNPAAHNPNRSTGDDSYGLAQINMLGSMGPARRRQFGLKANTDLLNPDVNARAMFRMSDGGQDFGAWGIGDNAYRSGAGVDTIRPHFARFPAALAAARGDSPRATPSRVPGGTIPAPPDKVEAALSMILDARRKRGADVSPILAAALEQRAARTRPAAVPPRERHDHVSPVQKGPLVRTDRAMQGTHVTDGLGWGTRTAADLMARPGTPVGAPADGTIVKWGSAQGGEALYFDDDDPDTDPDFWIGHVDRRLPVGTRVRAGQPLARVSAKHPSPHVHIDWGRAR
jgi:hypothetical protein